MEALNSIGNIVDFGQMIIWGAIILAAIFITLGVIIVSHVSH